jgi:hypothetical protein
METRETRPTENGAPVGGIILLFFGVLLLMQTTGYLPWALWDTLWRFWPVMMIIAGINLLLRKLNPWVVSVIITVILTGCVLYALSIPPGGWLRETIGIPPGVTFR